MDDVEAVPAIGDWSIAESISVWIEVVAIVVITVAVVAAFVTGARVLRTAGVRDAVERVKQSVGRGLLLGLDLLIAADVIRTVTLEPTLQNVAALGLLVVVRTFLSWSLMVELHGRWPWQGTPGTPTR
ncbi:DUF1622 domain-containing protein [Isoptericola haloaureus]|uniref:DUF1622 domain-containing protein n=1 Tax=Isoptericola haloaureus TaxID=1542902 RepID=A0ABU7Z9P6_9MICO